MSTAKRPKNARTRKSATTHAKPAAKKARAKAAVPPPPPSSSFGANAVVIPTTDALLGSQFNANVNCRPVTRKGKTRQKCDRQRLAVVGGATPAAEHPKRKQLFAVQVGQRFTVPDREIRRDLRAGAGARARYDAAPSCGDFERDILAGGRVPASAYEQCPSLPDAVEPAGGGDASFDFKANGAHKANGFPRRVEHHARTGGCEFCLVRPAKQTMRCPFGVCGERNACGKCIHDRADIFTPQAHSECEVIRNARDAGARRVDAEIARGYEAEERARMNRKARAAYDRRAIEAQGQTMLKLNGRHVAAPIAMGVPAEIVATPSQAWGRFELDGIPYDGAPFAYVDLFDSRGAPVGGGQAIVIEGRNGAVDLVWVNDDEEATTGGRTRGTGRVYDGARWHDREGGQIIVKGVAAKPNHHGGQHAPGDPLGVYMPPLEQWQRLPVDRSGAAAVRWTHPALGWTFDLIYPADRPEGIGAVDVRFAGSPFAPAGASSREGGYWKTGHLHSPELRGGVRAAYAVAKNWYASLRGVEHAYKPNRAPTGAAPGQTYVDRRADDLRGLRVSGDDYSGEVRTRAVGCDGKTPSHIVGGHVLPRSRIAAAVKREAQRALPVPPPPPGVAQLGPGPAEVIDVAPATPPWLDRDLQWVHAAERGVYDDDRRAIDALNKAERAHDAKKIAAAEKRLAPLDASRKSRIATLAREKYALDAERGIVAASPAALAAFPAERSPAATPRSLRAGHAPNTVYYFLRDRNGAPVTVLQAPHRGTVESIRRVAQKLQEKAVQYEHTHAGSQMLATNDKGGAGWAVSPNLAHINPVGTDEAAYTLGDLSRAPVPPPPPFRGGSGTPDPVRAIPKEVSAHRKSEAARLAHAVQRVTSSRAALTAAELDDALMREADAAIRALRNPRVAMHDGDANILAHGLVRRIEAHHDAAMVRREAERRRRFGAGAPDELRPRPRPAPAAPGQLSDAELAVEFERLLNNKANGRRYR